VSRVLPQQTASAHVQLRSRAAAGMPGGAFCVIAGAATGECRRVIQSGTAESNYTMGWVVDKPFTVLLDSGSHITILPYTGMRKRLVLSNLYLKMIILPRQARDKHRTS
jgi:hypothetical protein